MQQARFQDLQNPLQNKNIDNMGAWFRGTEDVWMARAER